MLPQIIGRGPSKGFVELGRCDAVSDVGGSLVGNSDGLEVQNIMDF